MNQAKFRGESHILGGEEYIIPPLSMGQSEELEAAVAKLSDPATTLGERNRIMQQLIGAAIKRNYPNFDVANLKDLLDLGNFKEVLDSVLSRSGYKRGAPVPGEPTAPLNGAASTQN